MLIQVDREYIRYRNHRTFLRFGQSKLDTNTHPITSQNAGQNIRVLERRP